MGKNGHCVDCQTKLVPVKLYAPEILRMFKGGYKEYSKNQILTSFAVCLSPHCRTGHNNLMGYQKVVDDGMIKVE